MIWIITSSVKCVAFCNRGQREECSNRTIFDWIERLESLEGPSVSVQCPDNRRGLGGVVWIAGRVGGKARTEVVGGREGGGWTCCGGSTGGLGGGIGA